MEKRKYCSQVVCQPNGKWAAVLLMMDPGKPNNEIIKQVENVDYETASVWADDELERALTGKGIWE
jgi:hypothetical protein